MTAQSNGLVVGGLSPIQKNHIFPDFAFMFFIGMKNSYDFIDCEVPQAPELEETLS